MAQRPLLLDLRSNLGKPIMAQRVFETMPKNKRCIDRSNPHQGARSEDEIETSAHTCSRNAHSAIPNSKPW